MKRPEGFDPATRTKRPQARPEERHEPDPEETTDGAAPPETPEEPAPVRWALAAYDDAGDVDELRDAEVGAFTGATNAQRVDREWRAKRRELAKQERQEARTLRRAAKQASNERKRRERAEVRRFTVEARRKVRIALITSGALVLALALLVGLVWSPLMTTREIRVVGAERLDPQVVEDVLADAIGQPLATVSEERVAERLAEIPQIESYRVDIVPPSSVVVNVVERRPVAIIAGGSGEQVIDAAGVVLGGVGADTSNLPRLNNIAKDSAEFQAVAKVLVSVPESVLTSIASLDAPTASDIRLTLTSGQVVQWGGADESGLKADVVAALIATQDPGTAKVFDVRAPERPVVRAG